jgi:ribosomal protein L21
MYAIIETGGKQMWVVPGETVKVEKLEVEPGAKLTFNALWAVGDNKEGQEGMWTVLKRYNEHEQKTLNALEELLPDYTFYGLFKVTGR